MHRAASSVSSAVVKSLTPVHTANASLSSPFAGMYWQDITLMQRYLPSLPLLDQKAIAATLQR